MESHALTSEARHGLMVGQSALLRLQSDDRLIGLIRRNNITAFDVLFQRYQVRLLAFCRHMLRSNEDAEDVLQEVFSSAYNAIRADDRTIQVRPWLYRIARNRCLNHLRRPVPDGQDTMDTHRDGNGTTAERAENRAIFRDLVRDVGELPESQRTALLLREIDVLSYEQIAEAMETTLPSVKSLLVRARISLAEAAEARGMTCDEVRLELGEAAEGLKRVGPPVRRHVRQCDRCKTFKAELKNTSRGLHSIYPVGMIVLLKQFVAGKLAGLGIGGSAVGGSATGGAAAGGSAIGAAITGTAGVSGSIVGGSAVGALGAKAAAVGVAATIAAAGAVGVQHKVAPLKTSTPVAVHSTSVRPVKAKPAVTVEETKTAPATQVQTEPPVQSPPAASAAEASQAPAEAQPTAAAAAEPDTPKVAEEEGTATLKPQPTHDTTDTKPGMGASVPPSVPVQPSQPSNTSQNGLSSDGQSEVQQPPADPPTTQSPDPPPPSSPEPPAPSSPEPPAPQPE